MVRAEFVTLEASSSRVQEHFELVNGEWISKMGKKRVHVNALVAVQAWLVRTFGEQFVNPKAPIDVAPEDNPTNEPEPDLLVLATSTREFRNANPAAGRSSFGGRSLRLDFGFRLDHKSRVIRARRNRRVLGGGCRCAAAYCASRAARGIVPFSHGI
jgi:hypothetical protein